MRAGEIAAQPMRRRSYEPRQHYPYHLAILRRRVSRVAVGSEHSHEKESMSTQITPTKANDLRSIITGEKMRQQFAAALPQHLTVDRFCRIALTALTRTPKLVECTQESLMRCLLDCSAYGIEPDGRRAHLIPYGNVCTLILDWKGLAELAMRSGIIAKLHADIVCENDVFEYNLGEVVKHEVNFREPRGAMYAAYAMAATKDGPVFVAVLTKEEIDGIRKRSKAGSSGPWVTDYNEMAKKTAFRRLAKWLPLSAEFRDAVEKDDDATSERDVTPKAARTEPLNPFEQPTALPATETIDHEGSRLAEFCLIVDDERKVDGLNLLYAQACEFAKESHRKVAKDKVVSQADSLGLIWDSKTGGFALP